ncbi:MAG: hypothetical protein L0229_22135 [Blastocatellia bacterium]|nr:hypothetical protein [Blastocatellia bacterium]
MAKDALLDSPLWEEFQKAARKRGRSPARLLADCMRECLEILEDQKLDEEIRRDARTTRKESLCGYREEDAVEIVRRHRREKKGQRATISYQLSAISYQLSAIRMKTVMAVRKKSCKRSPAHLVERPNRQHNMLW